ncbi:unnamed protein product, partial [Ectocarpus sp. 12 AP-2014]
MTATTCKTSNSTSSLAENRDTNQTGKVKFVRRETGETGGTGENDQLHKRTVIQERVEPFLLCSLPRQRGAATLKQCSSPPSHLLIRQLERPTRVRQLHTRQSIPSNTNPEGPRINIKYI